MTTDHTETRKSYIFTDSYFVIK